MNAAPRYILLYGPLTYLAHIPLYLLLGQTLFSFKLLGVSAFLITLAAVYRIGRHYADPSAAWLGLGCAGLVFFRYLHVEFWGRNDPLILCFTAIALWVVLDANDAVTALAAGAAFAALPNLKISAALYALPVFVFLVIHRGRRLALATLAVAAVLLPAPFLLPEVSWRGYFAVLNIAGKHGINPDFLVRNVQYSIVFLLPVLFLIWPSKEGSAGRNRWRRPQMLYLASIAVSLAAASVSGAKNGAGSYHLLPLTLPILHLYFWRRGEFPARLENRRFAAFALAWALTLLFYSANFVPAVFQAFAWAGSGRAAVAEIKRFETRYREQTLQVGVGDNFRDPRTFYAFEPVFQGQTYTISGAAIRDLQFGGVSIPQSSIRMLEQCQTRVWLIPRDQAPFSASNTYYGGDHPAFDAPFIAAFTANYSKAQSSDRYDAWVCSHP